MSVTGLVIFSATYVLIVSRRLSWLRLDRPAAALLGAVACVALGVLSPTAALEAVDSATILLLFGVMGMGEFLALDGFFVRVEAAAVARGRTPLRLLALVVWGAGLLSAFITNDAVCVLGVPIVVRLVKRHRLPPLPYLLALATAANTGSVATLVGNPQNMLCAVLGELSYRQHLVLGVPVAVVGLAINHAVIWLLFRRALAGLSLHAGGPIQPLPWRSKVTLLVIAGTAVAFTMGADLAWTAAGGFALLLLIHQRDARPLWAGIDWALLLFFAGLFVVVRGLHESGAPALFFERFPLTGGADGLWDWARLTGIFLVGSNIVSNVPFILVVQEQMSALTDQTLGWELLAMGSTFAGNLTLLGSVANIIVAEGARDVGGIGFIEHLKVGLPVALLTTAFGVAWMVALA